MFEEKTVYTQKIFSGRLIKLRVDRVILPDGRQSTREIVEHPGAAAVIPLDDDNYVYLVRQYRKPLEKHLLEIPAGTLEPGEEPRSCVQRELSEEVGLGAGKLNLLASLSTAPGFCNEVIHIFLATQLFPNPGKLDQDEFLKVEKYHFQEALTMIQQGEITDGKTVSGLLLAARCLT
ncbi:NUDIX domain-containing protein [Candidatus Contubernalis alkaliaceticus]|uniref:NUDIX domain-containing protein n=1 Tax=Candidatus Contubernalis alkaliaceticus TaxID=338645 RepID=UPI001F4BDC5F|nr:NUDIX hydrolase [Candidatus Contubernalis alkalaceticus]UNC91365.1 NUDIX hydrolase [Candidatus Contubernalis alkalaceticus]